MGGKWSFDAENRKKYPKEKAPPKVAELVVDQTFQEASRYIQKNFKSN